MHFGILFGIYRNNNLNVLIIMETKTKSSVVKIVGLFAIVLLAVIIGGTILLNKDKRQLNQLNSENRKLEDVLGERDSLVNEFVSAFDTIESSLTFINERRSQLVLENSETSPSQREAIIQDIKLMNTMLEESSKEIEELEKKLKNSGIQLSSFKNKIASLNQSIEQQNMQIVELTQQVEEQNAQLAMVSYQKDSLQNEVLSFQDTITVKDGIIVQQDEVINQQINELHKAFLAYGTIKELTQNGVVTKEGGFLGIGRNKTLKNDLNEEYFTKIDITEDRSIALNAKKVNLISEHPVDSYRLVEEDGLITRLEIETPEEFWKLSHYAVIEVK